MGNSPARRLRRRLGYDSRSRVLRLRLLLCSMQASIPELIGKSQAAIDLALVRGEMARGGEKAEAGVEPRKSNRQQDRRAREQNHTHFKRAHT